MTWRRTTAWFLRVTEPPAASVMFKYVFLFVVFGSFLEMTGATQFIIDFAERIFGRSPGGPSSAGKAASGRSTFVFRISGTRSRGSSRPRA